MRHHRTRAILLWLFALTSLQAFASRTSYRNAHPIGWMHLLPVGEQPGWSSPAWTNLELNHANVWNMEFKMNDRRNGDEYTYKADFEQSSIILDMGFALSEKLALSFELPYANRNGGFLDDFIDQFHQVIQSDRFFRHLNDPFDNSFVVRTNGQDNLASSKGQGLGSVKAKLKYWLWQYLSPTPGVCECGFAVSAQAKFPVQARQFGLSSGGNDYSGLAHLGVPVGRYSAAWSTIAFTKLGKNDTFGTWPRREWQQMYELSLDLGTGPHFGVILQARMESPIMMKEHLSYQHTYTTEEAQAAERVASGWNSLTAWRGSQNIGMRWRWGEGSQVNLLIVEDWALGSKDRPNEYLYTNNAPDVAFISQWHFVF